jgi:hypothetical protein
MKKMNVLEEVAFTGSGPEECDKLTCDISVKQIIGWYIYLYICTPKGYIYIYIYISIYGKTNKGERKELRKVSLNNLPNLCTSKRIWQVRK